MSIDIGELERRFGKGHICRSGTGQQLDSGKITSIDSDADGQTVIIGYDHKVTGVADIVTMELDQDTRRVGDLGIIGKAVDGARVVIAKQPKSDRRRRGIDNVVYGN